tara:strand:- start:35 stop:397 length:363 start_codon:yes stop_codon:yes gene_type:complete
MAAQLHFVVANIEYSRWTEHINEWKKKIANDTEYQQKKNMKHVLRSLDKIKISLSDCWAGGHNGYFCEEYNCDCECCTRNDFEWSCGYAFADYYFCHFEDGRQETEEMGWGYDTEEFGTL